MFKWLSTKSIVKDPRIEELERENDQLRKKLYEFTSANADATHAVDWKSLDAFSIERHTRDVVPITVIGYWSDEEVKEWSFYCSLTEHERLVKEFNIYIKRKNGS